jgi:hypothetical protein
MMITEPAGTYFHDISIILTLESAFKVIGWSLGI